MIDDHSRFAVYLEACTDERGDTVRPRLTRVFKRYGLPEAFYVDNGNPWGGGHPEVWTRFSVWLLKLGIEVIHSRPYHPQGRGKNERFHRTLKAEVFAGRPFHAMGRVQKAFDDWRCVYNFERPHQGLDMAPPASRYRASPRSMPDKLAEIAYAPDDIVRRVGATKAYIRFKGSLVKVPAAFAGERVAVRPTARDGRFGVYFGAVRIASLDLNADQSAANV